jgi:hypothetical protein
MQGRNRTHDINRMYHARLDVAGLSGTGKPGLGGVMSRDLLDKKRRKGSGFNIFPIVIRGNAWLKEYAKERYRSRYGQVGHEPDRLNFRQERLLRGRSSGPAIAGGGQK